MKDEKFTNNEAEELECAEHDGCCDDGEVDCGDDFTVIDENGKQLHFTNVATIDYEDKWYVFLAPAEEIEGISEDELLICRIDETDDGDVLVPVEDKKLLDTLYEEYIAISENDDCCCCDDEECASCHGHCHGDEEE